MTRSRILKLAAVFGLLALFAAGCGDDSGSTSAGGGGSGGASSAAASWPADSTMARIANSGTLKVGVKFDQPGFGLKNPTTGDVEGFDVEMAKIIASAIGPNVKPEFTESVSKNREPFLENGNVDLVIATYTINDTRKQVVDFAGPYFVAQQDIMVKSDNDTIKSVDDLNGKNVCSVTGSTSVTNVQKKAPQANITQFDTYSQCGEAMTDGRVDAVTTDNTILAGLVQSSDGKFKLVEAPFSNEPYGIGLQKGDDGFRTFLNDTLEKSYTDGSWAKAFESTLGELGLKTPEPPKVDRYTSTPAASGSSSGGPASPAASGTKS